MRKKLPKKFLDLKENSSSFQKLEYRNLKPKHLRRKISKKQPVLKPVIWHRSNQSYPILNSVLRPFFKKKDFQEKTILINTNIV